MARPATKKKTLTVDFSGVEVAAVIPEGEYIAEIVKTLLEDGDNGQYFAHEMKIVDGKYQGKKLFNNTSLAPQSLWATKKFLEAAGIEIPDGEVELDPADFVGQQLGVVVQHDTYKGRVQSKVVDVYPLENGEEPAADASEEEANDLPTKEEVMELGKPELRKLVAEHGLKVTLEGTTATQRRQVIKAIEEAGEKPSAAPAAKKEGGSKKKKVSPDNVNSMSADDLAELVETYDLDVDLDEHPILRRKRAAVIDSLEANDLLDEE